MKKISYYLKKDLPDICLEAGEEVELAYWNRDGDAIIHPVGEPGMQSSACVNPEEYLENYSAEESSVAEECNCIIGNGELAVCTNCTKYQLTLNSEQVNVLIQALDVFSRIGMGQLEIVAESLRDQYQYSIPRNKLQTIEYCLDAAKQALGHDKNSSFGILSPDTPKCSKIAYDIQCVVRQAVAKTENHGNHSVWHGNPLHTVKDVPLAEIKVVHKE